MYSHFCSVGTKKFQKITIYNAGIDALESSEPFINDIIKYHIHCAV